MKKLFLLLTILAGAVCCASAQYYNNNATPTPKIGIGLSSGFAVGAASGAYPELRGNIG